MVDKLRRITSIKKIGHAGTLDPFADGLLIMAIGREATKKIDQFVKSDKKYTAKLVLGATSDTYDNTGVIQEKKDVSRVHLKKTEEVIKNFLGRQTQIPPMYSAKKIQGKKLYELARQGISIERQPSQIEIFSIDIIKYEWPVLILDIHCSSGTYIRSVANDIGEKLNCGAYLEELKRGAIGDFKLEDAVEVEKLNPDNWDDYLFKL
jgi:tRNA pseudouridine55 synthase